MLTTLRQRNFALLWFGGLISMLGDWSLQIALPFYIYQVTGSTLATGAMFITGTVPRILLGSVAGVFVDRWDRKRTMVIANILLCFCILLLLAVQSAHHLWIVYLVAALEATIAQFILPAEQSLLPQLVSQDHLVPANALNALNNNLALLIGPALGGALVARFGLYAAVVLDGLSYALAALLIWRISLPAHDRASISDVGSLPMSPDMTLWAAIWQEWWAGLQMVKNNRVVATIFAATSLVAIGEGLFSVLLLAPSFTAFPPAYRSQLTHQLWHAERLNLPYH